MSIFLSCLGYAQLIEVGGAIQNVFSSQGCSWPQDRKIRSSCRSCSWIALSIGVSGLAVRVSDIRTASNFEQVANLQSGQVNSASYPSRDGKWVIAYELWGEGLVWLIGAVVCLCCTADPIVRYSPGNVWPHNAPRYHQLMPISCHFQHCKSASGHESDSYTRKQR